MSKRNIAYIKPEEPNFLKRIKEQAGYKEGPTVDTKRDDTERLQAEDFEDTNDELPTVVVLKPGDLTAEEVDQHKQQEEEKPADLRVPIVFKAPKKKCPDVEDKEDEEERPVPRKRQKKDKKAKTSTAKSLLSFDDEQDDD